MLRKFVFITGLIIKMTTTKKIQHNFTWKFQESCKRHKSNFEQKKANQMRNNSRQSDSDCESTTCKKIINRLTLVKNKRGKNQLEKTNIS